MRLGRTTRRREGERWSRRGRRRPAARRRRRRRGRPERARRSAPAPLRDHEEASLGCSCAAFRSPSQRSQPAFRRLEDCRPFYRISYTCIGLEARCSPSKSRQKGNWRQRRWRGGQQREPRGGREHSRRSCRRHRRRVVAHVADSDAGGRREWRRYRRPRRSVGRGRRLGRDRDRDHRRDHEQYEEGLGRLCRRADSNDKS